MRSQWRDEEHDLCLGLSRLVHGDGGSGGGSGSLHHLISPTVQYGLYAECELWRDVIET